MDNLGFLATANYVIKIKKILEKARKITLDLKICNAVTCDINKTKVILLSKVRK